MNYEQAQEVMVYEDALIYAFMPKDGACIGHVVIKTKAAKQFLDCSSDEIMQMFSCASITSSMVYEGLQAQGTNLILQDGVQANGENEVVLHVLPRKEGDGLNFLWAPQEFPPEKLEEIGGKLKENVFLIGNKHVEIQDDVPPPLEEQKSEEEVEQIMKNMTRYP